MRIPINRTTFKLLKNEQKRSEKKWLRKLESKNSLFSRNIGTNRQLLWLATRSKSRWNSKSSKLRLTYSQGKEWPNKQVKTQTPTTSI